MIIRQPGPIAQDFFMVGDPGVPVFLLAGDCPVLFDAGFACMGPLYADAINRIPGGKAPAFLLLTHSHFDHCGSAGYFQKIYPGLEICCSQQAKDIFARPGAIEVIKSLSQAAEQMIEKFLGEKPHGIPFEPFEITQVLAQGDVITVSGDTTVQVIETPGHTRDCLSYYVPEKKALIVSEAAGIPNPDGYIICDFLVGYDVYVESLQKLAGFPVEILALGHGAVLTGDDAAGYISKALDQCGDFCEWVWKLLQKYNFDEHKTMTQIRKKEYDNIPFPKQPEPAYMLNLEARVRAVKNKMAEESGAENG